MSEPLYDVIAIGNAIVDVMAPCEDALIERLGLARGPIAPEDILYFTPEPPERRRAPAARSLKPSGPVAHASESLAA